MFFEEPWHDNKFVNKSGIPIPNILLNFFLHVYNPQLFHLFLKIDKLDNQYRHNFQWYYKWHNLTLWNILLHFYVPSHKTLPMLKHRYYFFITFFIGGCVVSANTSFIYFSTFSFNNLFKCNVGLTIYPIANSLISSSV